MKGSRVLWFIIVACSISACNTSYDKDFEFMEPKQTGVTFNNQIPDYDYINILNHEYLYNGGGVAASDFNKDGLIDLVFSGNLVSNALYLNEGDFKFNDVSQSSGITAKGAWCTGVTIVDINDDGWSDIYFCTSSFNASTKSSNLLFVHQGLDDNGAPVFVEQAADYGLQSGKSSMHGHFFDYDRDGDLDLYLLNNVLDLVSPTDYRYKRVNGEAPNTDQLFANDGNGNFIDVSAASGVTIEGYGLGAAIADYNADGWLDIYVANDYVTNDILYINQQDGTFKNEIGERLDKQSKFCMGAIAADFNNDLSLDIVTLDMLAMDNGRLKQLYAASYYPNIYNNTRYKYEEQNVRNMYHVNDGTGNFSEQGYLAGLIASDWSWSPLAADFDLDGDEDLYITNGFPKDITDLDFINYRKSKNLSLQREELLEAIPEVKISNQLFINDGASSFSNATVNSGLDRPSISHGAVAVDLDNDGDLDIVTHNLNEPASIIQNRMDSGGLTIELDSSLTWSQKVGTRIEVSQADHKLTKQWMPSHSYLSSIDAPLLFGGIDLSSAIRVKAYWPDGTVHSQEIDDVSSGSIVVFKLSGSVYRSDRDDIVNTPLVTLLSKEATVDRRSDFDYQKTIPIGYHDYGCPMIVSADHVIVAHPRDRKIYKLDQSGALIEKYYPNQFITAIESGDIDGDNIADIVYSGLKENGETAFGYYPSGLLTDKIQLDITLPLSYHYAIDDADGDGQSDLIYVAYPYKGSYPDGSYILVVNNVLDKAQITDTLTTTGVIRDMILEDIDRDGDKDIITVGHWMTPTIWLNNEGIYTEQDYGLSQYSGLWNNIDYLYTNDDGTIYFGLGNIGQNTALSSVSSTIKMVSLDIDNNGTIDPIVGISYGNEARFIPYDLRDDLVMQVPSLKKIYGNYHDYSNTDYDDLLRDLDVSPSHQVNYVQSAVLSIKGEQAEIQALPIEAQIAPVYAMEYVDTSEELIVVGNTTQNREFWGSYTSSDGSVYKQSNGTWQYHKEKSLALKAEGEGRVLSEWNGSVLIAYRDGRLEQLNLSDEVVQ